MKKTILASALAVSTILTVGTTTNPVEAASFNCRYAKLPVEISICQNSHLHRLDERMARKYFRLKNSLPGYLRRELAREQRHWIRSRNRCGYDEYCITSRYTRRIRQLNRWLSDY